MKYFLGVLILAVLLFGGYNWYMGQTNDYYVKITNEGKKVVTKADNETYTSYAYELNGYDEDGTKKVVAFNGNLERPLKLNHYLKVSEFKHKSGVKTYEEVQFKDIPYKAKAPLK
ncbi:YxeA family protein [Brochothrix thermosphacta]|uniref:YxeA family protein n=1 Tax=Brochothrix thermosphacta TaxID=2756 RepID=UPI00083F77D7|nr:YxeA family protein [Brochothrix thermosphacta]ODJ53025.1 hypothetical protein BFR41_09935 [Brochothrix thermosphacta]ODJ69991.1 hypothetical protein BFR43_09285 [Brochothrix thermosphacta]